MPNRSHPMIIESTMEPGCADRSRTFYIWVLPLLWATCSLVHFRFPGDEYAMYTISSIAGSWIAALVNLGDIHNPLFPISIALTGAIVMAGTGYLMDRARIQKAMWASLFLVTAVVVFVMSIKSYPTIERALSKQGSWWAYIFSSLNVGLYVAILLSFLTKGVEAAWRRIRTKNARC